MEHESEKRGTWGTKRNVGMWHLGACNVKASTGGCLDRDAGKQKNDSHMYSCVGGKPFPKANTQFLSRAR